MTSLAELWASPDYLEVASCTVSWQETEPVLLTQTHEAAAETAVPGTSDPASVVEGLLATCTRLPPGGGPDTLPSSALRAALLLCPDAPHGDLLHELTPRGEATS